MGVKYDKESFADIFDKCEKFMPEFVVKCLLKAELSEDEQYFIDRLTEDEHFIPISTVEIEEGMKSALKKTFMAKTKIDRAMKNPEKCKKVLELLEARNVDIDSVLSPEQKNKTKQ